MNLLELFAVFNAFVRSASRFSNVPRSVLPPSSSDKRPDKRNSDSMRPRRFSRPSMYFALYRICQFKKHMRNQIYIPFWRVALLLHLCEDAFRLVVDAV